MSFTDLIDSRLELLKYAIEMKDELWTKELKITLENLIEAKSFVDSRKKKY